MTEKSEGRWILMIYDMDRYKIFRTNYPTGLLKNYPHGIVLVAYYVMDDYYAQVIEARMRLLSRKQKISLANNNWVKTKCCPIDWFVGLLNLMNKESDSQIPGLMYDVVRKLRATQDKLIRGSEVASEA